MKEESQDYADTFIREIFHTFEGQITEDVVMDWIRVAFTQGIRHGKSFTPGVPTEDGWYVVKSERNEYTFCGYKAWSAVEPKPMTQLEKAREEIAAYQAEHYPHGECPECGFALDSEGNCTRSDYAYPDED